MGFRFRITSITAAVVVACSTGRPGTPSPRGTSKPLNEATPGPDSVSCLQASPDDPTIYDTSQVTVRPVIRTGPVLAYPSEPRARGIQGRVVISAVVNPSGYVGETSVIQSVDPQLDAAAMRYVIRASFSPGCLDGHAVKVRVAIPIDFRLGL